LRKELVKKFDDISRGRGYTRENVTTKIGRLENLSRYCSIVFLLIGLLSLVLYTAQRLLC
jgi:hypothetical protein